MAVVDNKFPTQNLVPKQETGVLNFLKKYPEYDGKDVTIAIFDSGVDGKVLQYTSRKEIKVIERFDCSGAGDVDVSKIVIADDDNCIIGLSGTKLKLTEFMKTKNLSGKEYHVGLRSLYDIYPSKIRDKITSDLKAKIWDEPHKTAIAEVSRDIDNFESSNSANLQNLPLKDKLKKEDNESALEFLNYSEKKLSDLKTTFDCVVFPTELGWVAVIDLTEKGDLENALKLVEYSKSKEIQSIDEYLSVSINVHNDGNKMMVLEIVGMCSSHGTHVASIASGFNEDNNEENGVAPGAKIVSFTIGDCRLVSMETGTAIVRAMIKVMELCNSGTKIDIINMSYGEHAHFSNSGRIGELMNEIINKYGVVWIASAGNQGPALCTIGTPPDISSNSVIGVGAYVSPDMMEAEHSLRQKLPANVYSWSSRDPCIDGGQGVTICAPGAAITSVPEFTLSHAQLMNGTSMAAPHCSGAVALLISGLKQRGLKYSPYSIKRALWNTATKLTYVDPFAQGNGLLNVEKAFDHLLQYNNEQEVNVRFDVRVNSSKGIHMRQRFLKKPKLFNVFIEPVFFNEKEASPKDKINFNLRLTLVPSDSWVQCGTYLDLCYQARSYDVCVDPTALPPGVHSASVKAYDSTNIEKGTLFEIPITVVQPEIQHDENSNIFFSGTPILCKANTIIRKFFVVPNYATWAVLRMVATEESGTQIGGRFDIHTMQILPQKYCKALETKKSVTVNNETETVHAFKCLENNILEMCIAKYWSDFSDTCIKFSIEFHGIKGSNYAMHGANGIHRINVTACTPEEFLPTITLKFGAVVLKPIDSKISPLTTRDIIPPGRQIYQNVLTYNLHIIKTSDVSLDATMFSSVLYESNFESQLWMIFDCNKMMVGVGDAYSRKKLIKLEKGDYVIKLQIRHEKKELLEKVSESVMVANFRLTNTISPDIYYSYNSAVVQGAKCYTVKLESKLTRPIFIAPISNDKLTKSGLPPQCSWIEGSITYAKDELGKKCDINSFEYFLTEGSVVKKTNGGSCGGSGGGGSSSSTTAGSSSSTVTPKEKEVKSKKEEYKEGLRDYQNSMIPKLDFESAEEIYKEILEHHPTFSQVHLSLIQNLEANEIKTQLPFTFKNIVKKQHESGDKGTELLKFKENLQKIADLAKKIIQDTDKDTLLAYYGVKSDNRLEASKIKTTMDKQKSLLIDAYIKRAVALAKIHIINVVINNITDDEFILDELNTIYIEIGKYIDLTDTKVSTFILWHAYINKHYGRMSKYLIKLYEDKLQKDVIEETRNIAIERKWPHILTALNKAIVTTNPGGYRLF